MSGDVLPLPLTTDQIDADWLTRAIGTRLPGVVVEHAEVVDVLCGTSTKVRVRVRDRGGVLPATLIVKGGFESHSPSMAPMYANEALFYSDVQPLVPMRSPRCYFAGDDPASHQALVIMEDLRRPGVRFLSGLEPMDRDAMARRIRAMAHYHGPTWESPLFDSGAPLGHVRPRFQAFTREYMSRYLEPEVWRHYMASPRGAAVSSRLHDREQMAAALDALAALEEASPQCLHHGDTHLGNLYIEEDGTPGFFDAQVVKSHWAFEVAYHIVCAVDLADREAWEFELLDIYADALAEVGGPRLKRDTLVEGYRKGIAWGLFIFLINETRFQSEAVNTAYAARFGAAALAHGTIGLLGVGT